MAARQTPDIVLYVGRKVRLSRFDGAPECRGKFATVLRLPPDGATTIRYVQVRIEELDPWVCCVKESTCCALSEAQDELARKHGLPGEFVNACLNALGKISIDEAREAWRKYTAEFLAAE